VTAPTPLLAAQLATALRGTFRVQAPGALDVSPEVMRSAQVSGVEALVSRRMAAPDRRTERYQILEQSLRERRLAALFALLESHGIRAATFKGWTLSRLYPAGLRPVGDVDLLVQPDDAAHARAVLASLSPAERPEVDLQSDVSRYLPDRSLSELLDRSTIELTASGPIRVLGAEDHLRLVCLHQLHHGAWRPLWLCDVAVLLESLPADFSWVRCLGGSRRRSEAVLACVGLAVEWLGAEPRVAPPAMDVPSWFRGAVASAWERGFRSSPELLPGIPLRRLAPALRARWPDPLSATLHLGAPLRWMPRFPVQLAELARRAGRHATRRWRSAPVPPAAGAPA
jgi:hypothetical protein